MHALAQRTKRRAVHIERLERAQALGADVPGLHLDLAAHAMRVDDLTDLDVFGRLSRRGSFVK